MYIQIGRERILILDIRGAKCFCEGDWTEGTPQTTGTGFISWVKFRFTELISLGFSLFVTFSYPSPERHTSKSMWVKTHFQGIMWSLFTSSGGEKKSVCQVTLKTPFITSGCLCKWISCVQLLPHRSLMLSWIRTTLLGHLENVVHPERTPRCQELQWANGPTAGTQGPGCRVPFQRRLDIWDWEDWVLLPPCSGMSLWQTEEGGFWPQVSLPPCRWLCSVQLIPLAGKGLWGYP